MPYSDFGDWLSRWKGGEAIQALARDLSESAQELQEKDEARSLLTVPIFVETHLWGVVGFDDCTAERVWGESEIAVLETAAACIASAIERDRTQKEKAAAAQTRVTELAERDHILEATAAAANVMLTDEDFDSAVNKALRIVGEGLAVDRINLGKYFEAMPPQNTGYHHFLYEWDSDNTVIQTEHPELAKIPDKGIESAVEAFRKGEVFGGIIDELPEPFRSAQIALGVKSTYAIPIRIQGRYWGVIAFDDCHQQTRRSEAELEALMTLANCIGSAISREQTQKAREAAERKVLIATERAARAAELEAANQILITRDRWLQTTAVAVSELLSTEQPEISVNAALKTIGENLSCDRVGIMRHLPAQKGQGSFRVLYEWDSSGTPTQIGNNDLVEMPASDFADWTERLIAGESIGGLISEQQEPFRSKLQTLGTVFAYAVPIFIDAEFWGLMFMDYCREVRQLTSAELAVFDTTATCVGSAIHRAQIQRDRLQAERSALIEREREKAARDRATELAKTNEALSKTLNALTETPEPDEFLGQILASICQHIEACTASLFLYDETTHTLSQHLTVQDGQTYLGTAPTDPDMFRRPIPADLSNGWKAITESKKPFTVDERHPENDALMWPESVPWHQEKGHLSATCACMRVGNKPIGFIGFAFRHLPTLSDEQLEFIQSLTNQATLSIHLTSLADEAKQTAILQEQEKAARDRVAELAK
ncbi:MAG: GAF domain-containing protein, partial [Cyanobacteria bacterium J06560_2]